MTPAIWIPFLLLVAALLLAFSSLDLRSPGAAQRGVGSIVMIFLAGLIAVMLGMPV